MKAVVQNAYGNPDVLSIKEVPIPKPKDGQVLVRVKASSVNAGDLFTMKGSPFMVRLTVGFPKPKDFILGWDVSGIIESVGKGVKDFKIGDEVYGCCMAAFAEFAVMDKDQITNKPSNLTHEETAAVPTAAITALQRLRDGGKLGSGMNVLVIGASGGVGSFAVQIVKAFGSKVTGTCRTEKVEMVRSMGAEKAVDYMKDDISKCEDRFDIILDNAGNYSFSILKKLLKPGGIIVPNSGHGGMGYVIKAFALAPFSRKIAAMKVADLNGTDFTELKEMIEEGDIKPFIHRTFTLDEVSQAMAFLESGGTMGKIVIRVS